MYVIHTTVHTGQTVDPLSLYVPSVTEGGVFLSQWGRTSGGGEGISQVATGETFIMLCKFKHIASKLQKINIVSKFT